MHGSAELMNGSSTMDVAKAKSLNAVCGSLIIREDNQLYNRFVWVTPNGEIEYYNKNICFLMGEENSLRQVEQAIHYKDWKICPQICYDLRFLFLAGMI